MSKTKTKYSTCAIIKTTKKGNKIIIGYLSARDEENGLDIHYDMLGYTIIAL